LLWYFRSFVRECFRVSVPFFVLPFLRSCVVFVFPFFFRACFCSSVPWFVSGFVFPFLFSCVHSCFFPPSVRCACCKACTSPYDLQDTDGDSSATDLSGGTTQRGAATAV
jgi:hypothetical protein